ncbi:MAG: DUF1947 domain-containing protein [Candidatus Bathyarchaeia archaeon]
MCGVKHRYALKTSEKRALIKRIAEIFNVNIKEIRGEKIEIAELRENKTLIIINNKPLFIEVEGNLIPTLIFEDLIKILPRVFVDMGAIPHICNGADVMAPGITRVDGRFKEGEIVVVLDERYGKAIAIARALVSSENIKSLKRGKVLKNLHYVGDSIWKAIKSI